MRSILHICLMATMSLGFAGTTFAQDKPAKDETVKTEKQTPAKADKAKAEPLDIDAFFKRGEEAAKKGSECSKPAEPVA